MILNRNLTVMAYPQFTNENGVACEISLGGRMIIIINVYVPPKPIMDRIDMVLRKFKGKKIIVLGISMLSLLSGDTTMRVIEDVC